MDDGLNPVFRALGDPTRRAILDALYEKPLTTGELASRFPDITRYAVMKHLKVLVEADLVVVRREGKRRWNALNPVPLRVMYRRWVGKYMEHWAEAGLNLKEMSELRDDGQER